MAKGIQKLLQDSRVHSVSDERDTGDGYFVYLHKGYSVSDDATCHTIHEATLAECFAALKGVKQVPLTDGE